MALLPDIEAKYEDLFIQFLNQPAVFAKLQGEWVRSQHPPTPWNLRGGR
jgi:hypothetical protein